MNVDNSYDVPMTFQGIHLFRVDSVTLLSEVAGLFNETAGSYLDRECCIRKSYVGELVSYKSK